MPEPNLDDLISDEDEENVIFEDHPIIRRRSLWAKWLNFRWLRTIIGASKIAQFILLLIGLIMMFPEMHRFGDPNMRTAINFFVFVQALSIISTIISIVLYVTNLLQYKIPDLLTSNIVLTVCCEFGALLHLVSSMFMLGYSDYDHKKIIAGLVGLVLFILLQLETLFYYTKARRDGAFLNTGIDQVIEMKTIGPGDSGRNSGRNADPSFRDLY